MDTRVYLVTDDPSRYLGDWLENVASAISGGVTCVQYRDVESNMRRGYARVCALKDLLVATHTPLIVNNDVGLALAVGAQGIHVGQNDMPPDVVRAIVGPSMDVGLSITSSKQVDARLLAWLKTGVVNRVGIGPVWDARHTKMDAAPEMGVTGFRQILDLLPPLTPHVAIGGITLKRARMLAQVGAQGVALVSAFSKADEPAALARALRAIF